MAKRKVFRAAKAAQRATRQEKEKTHHQQIADDKANDPPGIAMRRAEAPITTPLPEGARRLRSGSAVVIVGGVQVTLLPDRIGSSRGAAETDIQRTGGELSGYNFDTRTNIITRPGRAAPIRFTIQTTYSDRSTRGSEAAYGRGTTAADRAAGRTSLAFHEGSHGTDFLSYIATNPLPQFGGRAGMTVEQYQAAVRAFIEALLAYDAAIREYSKRMTDCVGTPSADCD